jgi:hypothetical protein
MEPGVRRFILVSLGLAIVLYVGGAFHTLNKSDIQELLVCSSASGAYYIPASACGLYMERLRGNKDDIHYLDGKSGISFLFDLPDAAKKYRYLTFLLDKGANINAISPIDGLTPLHGAILRNDSALVNFLLKRGADTGIKERNTQLPPYEFAQVLQEKNPAIDRSQVLSALSHYVDHP